MQNVNLIESGVYAPIFSSTGIELQNLIRHYTNDKPEKLKYLIKASLFCQFAATNNSLKSYETVEEFLVNYEGSMPQDKDLENKVREHFPTFVYSTFCTYAVHLLKFYNKKVKEDASLTLNSILSEFEDYTRHQVQQYVKMFSKQNTKSKTSTAMAPVDSNNNIAISPLMAASNRSMAKDYEKELFPANNTNIDGFEVNMKLFEELPLSPPHKPTSSSSDDTLDNNNSSKEPASRRSPRKRTGQSNSSTPKKRRIPPKTKPIDCTVKRTTITTDETALLVLQKQVAHLSNLHSIQEIMAALELQRQIKSLCIQLKDAIANNYNMRKKNKSSSRDGFKVTYSNNMGYHCQNSGLKGFTINDNNKFYHNFDEDKREQTKNKWEQEIWDIGIQLMKLKGLIKDKGEELCMEFGFMKKGDYVDKV